MPTPTRISSPSAASVPQWIFYVVLLLFVSLVGVYSTYVVDDVKGEVDGNRINIKDLDTRQRAVESDLGVIKSKIERIEKEQGKAVDKLDRILDAVRPPH